PSPGACRVLLSTVRSSANQTVPSGVIVIPRGRLPGTSPPLYSWISRVAPSSSPSAGLGPLSSVNQTFPRASTAIPSGWLPTLSPFEYSVIAFVFGSSTPIAPVGVRRSVNQTSLCTGSYAGFHGTLPTGSLYS